MTDLLLFARLCLAFGQVNRVTFHPDGVTPESDTDHTFMLGMMACSIAANHPELALNVGLVAQFSYVHDFVEVHALDTPTFGISAEGRAEKEAREGAALKRLEVELAAFPWVLDLLHRYERQEEPEARFVRYLDKLCPRLTHILNGGAAYGASPLEEVHAHHVRHQAELAATYPEFAAVLGPLISESSRLAEEAYARTCAQRLGEWTYRYPAPPAGDELHLVPSLSPEGVVGTSARCGHSPSAWTAPVTVGDEDLQRCSDCEAP
jgi:5'-deoxynucleotidase YfbR-like HD superfamily hydrolase